MVDTISKNLNLQGKAYLPVNVDAGFSGARISHNFIVPLVDPVYSKLLSLLLNLHPINVSLCSKVSICTTLLFVNLLIKHKLLDRVLAMFGSESLKFNNLNNNKIIVSKLNILLT